MHKRSSNVLAILIAGFGAMAACAQSIEWSDLPPIPDVEGYAGPIAGVSEGKLLVGGGTNFPDKRPWEGGTKHWYDTVFVLEVPTDKWHVAGKLPQPLAYSVCVTTPRGIAVLGGSNATGHTPECFWLRLVDAKLEIEPLPPLPVAVSNACGSLLNGRLFLAGGTLAPNAVHALDTCYSIALEHSVSGWRKEPNMPGPPRMLATAAALDGAFYVLGGVKLSADEKGQPRRTYLRDAYRYDPGKGWTKIANLPWPMAASPSPAPIGRSGQLFILGGDDGNQVDLPPQSHAGFRRDVLTFDASQAKWTSLGRLPTALVTTTTVTWNGHIIVPGGEVRPGVRSTQVLSGKMK
jgi:N-acetylneuraminic acid mutarotase